MREIREGIPASPIVPASCDDRASGAVYLLLSRRAPHHPTTTGDCRWRLEEAHAPPWRTTSLPFPAARPTSIKRWFRREQSVQSPGRPAPGCRLFTADVSTHTNCDTWRWVASGTAGENCAMMRAGGDSATIDWWWYLYWLLQLACPGPIISFPMEYSAHICASLKMCSPLVSCGHHFRHGPASSNDLLLLAGGAAPALVRWKYGLLDVVAGNAQQIAAALPIVPQPPGALPYSLD